MSKSTKACAAWAAAMSESGAANGRGARAGSGELGRECTQRSYQGSGGPAQRPGGPRRDAKHRIVVAVAGLERVLGPLRVPPGGQRRQPPKGVMGVSPPGRILAQPVDSRTPAAKAECT